MEEEEENPRISNSQQLQNRHQNLSQSKRIDMSPQIQQKQDQVIYKYRQEMNFGQLPRCLYCNKGEIKLENLFKNCPDLGNENKSKYPCFNCQQETFLGKCPNCPLYLLSKQDIQYQLELFCENKSCETGSQRANQDQLSLDTFDIIIKDYNLQMNDNQIGSQMEEEKQNQGEDILDLAQQQQQQQKQYIFYQKVEKSENFCDIQCAKCTTSIRLVKNKDNLVYLSYKRELCTKCQEQIYYTFCECGELIYSYEKFQEEVIIECSQKCDKITEKICQQNSIGPDNNYQACNGIVQYSQKSENEADQFYRKTACNKCATPDYYFYCKCQELLSRKAKPFLYGEQIECPNRQCHLKKFQLVRCPLDHCQQINVFKGDYKMGSVIKCLKCQNDFQQVTCPECNDSLYFQGEYTSGEYVECPCKSIYQQVSCPYCYKAQFRIKDKDNRIQSGQPITCDNQTCKKEFYNINCPQCHKNLKYPKIEQNFKQGNYYKCTEEKCNLSMEWYTCHQNHVTSNIVKNPLYRQQQQKKDIDHFSFGIRQCKIQNCNNKMTLHFCPHCQEVNKQDEVIEEGKTNNCQKCKKNFNTIKCEKCLSVNSIKTKEEKIQCFNCNHALEILNTEDPNQGLCKICYGERAIYAMSTCMHVVCCQDCKDQVKQHGKCAICRKPGEPKKLFF